ncbi:hypothetical protein GPK34_00635 [Secundilactobacillus kimchicus]|nr:hypothetical protein [Secundilactobacillus kimchicus]
MTKRMMKEKKIDFEERFIDVDNSPAMLNKLREEGYAAFPVVKVYNDQGAMLDNWDAFHVDRINRLEKMV